MNVLIATPGHSLMGAYVQSLMETGNALHAHGLSWAWSNKYSSHVADVREITLSGSYVNNIAESRPMEGRLSYDKIIWIDSDISWTPDAFFSLYDSPYEIVSGAYLLENDVVPAYPSIMAGGLTRQDVMAMEKPIKVDAAGFGFLAVKHGIFEVMSRPWFQQVPVTFVDKESGREMEFPIMGEDMSWCQRAIQMGHEVWFDPRIKVQHHKMQSLTW